MLELRTQCCQIQVEICWRLSNKIWIAFKANSAIKPADEKNLISRKDKNARNYDIINIESQQIVADQNVGNAKFNKVVMVIIKVSIIEGNRRVVKKE